MELVINTLLVIALLVVLTWLGLGVYSMSRGGEFNAKWGNRFMRYRVMSQGVAVVIVLIGFWWKATHR
jgi:hypothetical protein